MWTTLHGQQKLLHHVSYLLRSFEWRLFVCTHDISLFHIHPFWLFIRWLNSIHTFQYITFYVLRMLIVRRRRRYSTTIIITTTTTNNENIAIRSLDYICNFHSHSHSSQMVFVKFINWIERERKREWDGAKEE